MTRDEVRELIVKAIDDSTQLIDFGDFTVSETDFDAASEAVLAAFAARGILLGEHEDRLPEEPSFSNRGFARYCDFRDKRNSNVFVSESSGIEGGLWIYCKKNDDEYDTPLLNRAQAETVIMALINGLNRQWFEEDPDDRPADLALVRVVE